jgi:hypothetical protein
MNIAAAVTATTTGMSQVLTDHIGHGHQEIIMSHPKDILNGPCNMHYFYGPNGKKVSNHLMKDCCTFLKLQGAFGTKQAEARNQGYVGTPGSIAYNAPPPPPMPANGAMPTQGKQNPNN